MLGCQRGSPTADEEPPREPPALVSESLRESSEFVWGQGKIVLGMTKVQVVREIELSWKRPASDPFEGMDIPGIQKGVDPATAGEVWVLSFGPHTGHAPGGGTLSLTFRDGKLTKIVVQPTVAG